MKRLLLLLTLSSSVLNAQTYYMNVHTKGGGTTSIPLNDVQKLTFSGTIKVTGKEGPGSVIRTFALLQNYPNPFNPSTTITFQTPGAGTAEIRIFNLTGQLVRTISTTFSGAGTYKVLWDGKTRSGQSAASGAYIYQVAFENSVLAKKMLFIK